MSYCPLSAPVLVKDRTLNFRLVLLGSEFKAVHGHTIVPQNSGSLGNWVRMQRVDAKKFKDGKKSAMTAEKILKLTQLDFCFDASARFNGSYKNL